jgi:hypothetical protein
VEVAGVVLPLQAASVFPTSAGKAANTRNDSSEMRPGAVARLARKSWTDTPRTHSAPTSFAGRQHAKRDDANPDPCAQPVWHV